MYSRIRNLREDNDLPQKRLAEFLHVTQATYSRYETGILDPPSYVWIKLADFYNVSVDYLMERTEIKELP